MTTAAPPTPVAPATGSRPPRHTAGQPKVRAKEQTQGMLFIAPFLITFLLFLVWPVLYGFYQSLTGQSLTGANSELIGFANYFEAFGDSQMWRSLGNTVVFTIASTIPLLVVGLVLALLVNLGLPGQWLWRLAFFLPFLLASTVVSLFWLWMYNPQLGVVNAIAGGLGLPQPAWLQDSNLAMTSVVITTVWWTVGFNFLIYLAALQNIPDQQYEAAALDGAGKWRQLFSITIPQLAPTTALLAILQVLASLKVFDQIYQMTAGGPGGATRPIVQYVFETGFTGFRFGYSAAISYIFFALIVVISVIQFTATRRKS
ncbi:sugar ABC transporter permease [Clavibacter michiganensis]|uniref:Sugar ABC transporter permease n=1 Tax=Clavibacter michiganensis TaxID=28447 RepID=A0A2S5VMG1_9MICO|nr:sugar ABC transporter permease [Clavibacter michiganensis]PPF56169.1 sugar ABC transporter permease [Clavibacter michiganensis]PPF63861.1 sugar ABC transporter permease [Clavibacter michiganensis]